MKSIIPVFLLMLLLSCSQDETNQDGAKINRDLPIPIIEFVAESNNVSHHSDGSTYQDQVTVRLANPEVFYFNESVEFTLRVDEQNSTAIEGVDFNFTSSSYIFNNFNNFTQHIDIEILTEEVYTSFTKEIIFIAQVVGSDIETRGILTINYECFVDLTGTYSVTNDFCLNNIFYPSVSATITRADNGKWHLSSGDGFWALHCAYIDFAHNWGNIEVNNCDIVEPSIDIFHVYEINNTQIVIGEILGGTWDQQNGILEMSHTENFFNGGPYTWNSRYVRQ